MSNEIKFRAWFSGEMHDEIVLVGHQYCIVERGLGCPLNAGIKDFLAHDDPDTPMILMQYTGLKDKNDVEIYEGDIFKREDTICVIFWSDGMCAYMWHPIDEDEGMSTLLPDSQEMEVIGNIYQDSHLLD